MRCKWFTHQQLTTAEQGTYQGAWALCSLGVPTTWAACPLRSRIASFDVIARYSPATYNQDSEVWCHRCARRRGGAGRVLAPVAIGAAGLTPQGVLMTLDEAVALSLMPDLSRVGLADRLRADDPVLLEASRALHDRAQAARMHAETVGIHVLPWTDSRFPAALLAIPDMPPVLWYRGALDALRAPAVAVVSSNET